jgi:glycosyltransferase involved in cell wall biosynthesis
MHSDFKFRFVISVKKEDFLRAQGIVDSEEIDRHYLFLGTVSVAECPSLYEQCDIELQPSLLESFTATYPEAMRMGKPIVSTDLAYARQLCGDAACYYSALDAEAAAEAIYKVATEKGYAARLVSNGRKQLLQFDTYNQRADKLMKIIEKIDN